MESYDVVVRFFQNGGPFMYPIAVVLVIGLAIAVERWLVLSTARARNRRAFATAMARLEQQEYRAVVEAGAKSSVPIARIVAAGISRYIGSRRREDIESAMEEGVMEALPRLEKRTQYLATLANVATLLGLLGTIIGLIAAFTAVANAEATEKASMLSSSISVAMNTTAFGLISAIPLLLLHAVLQTKTTEIVDSFEMASVKVVNTLADAGALPAKTRTSDG
ncbi:MotA/TolQ/ExbB proton channel family protein [Pseudohalioglobus sediminis]|uniref:MotA/TolQ/ExbB proton channel family protein n=1 Tax=Pseudohalioglobus sediminis TaxID=2606449 RepID=A0A5B0X152_9GAMM|nr:MotA/TolQ/ExbB proton channel family protein [Pseudohalioglobus sediminis]KAA1192385.1 MotA/TolQ/ExbB proton channel family protein [Pseudohalioglobus sediminis]